MPALNVTQNKDFFQIYERKEDTSKTLSNIKHVGLYTGWLQMM
jgi:hypothetical protein